MPISQSRMIALINAARDYQDYQILINEYIRTLRDQSTEPQVRQLYDELLHAINPIGQLRDPVGSALVIQKEETHFRRVRNINIQAAKRQALKRPTIGQRSQDLGVQPKAIILREPRTTSPIDIARRPQMTGSIQDTIAAEIKQESQPQQPKNKNRNVPGLYDDDDDSYIAPNAESMGSGLALDVAARAEIDQEIRKEEEAERLAEMLRNRASKPG